MPIRKILVPIDFSPHSLEATRWATDLAQRYDAQLTLAHVVQPIPWATSPEGVLAMAPDLMQRLRDDLGGELEKARREAAVGGTVVEATLLDGIPATEVVELARRGGFDLIVMGTHGRTGIKHALLGSIAEKVVRRAPCPVLTVRLPGQK